MDATQFETLDRAVEAGDGELAANALADGKAGKKALADLVAAGYLEARKKKFALTPTGRAEWEQHASPERRAAIRERQDQEREQRVLALVSTVEKTANKPLKPKDLAAFGDDFVSEVVALRLIEPGTKDGSYRLTAAGRGRMLGGKPLDVQVERIREVYEQTQAEWSAAQKAIERGLKGLPGGAVSDAVSNLQERLRAAAAAYDAAVNELKLTAGLTLAAAEMNAAVRTAREEASQRLEQVVDREAKVLEAVRGVEARMTEFRHEFGPVVANLPRAAAPSAEPAAPDTVAWKATGDAYSGLREKSPAPGAGVRIPELSDAVLAAVPELTPASFRAMLSQWHDEGRLVLQVCKDPDQEPRAAEGIESARGLLFYVQLSTV